AFDHVLVGYDVARWIDNESGTETLHRLADLARTRPVITEKLGIKILNRVAYRPADDALSVDVQHRRQNLRDCQHGRFGSRISLREGGCRSCQEERDDSHRAGSVCGDPARHLRLQVTSAGSSVNLLRAIMGAD